MIEREPLSPPVWLTPPLSDRERQLVEALRPFAAITDPGERYKAITTTVQRSDILRARAALGPGAGDA